MMPEKPDFKRETLDISIVEPWDMLSCFISGMVLGILIYKLGVKNGRSN